MQTQRMAIWRTRSERLTMPSSRSPSTTGTRRMRWLLSRCATSSTSVWGLTVTTPRLMISATVRPSFAIRSCSVTTPMRAPAALTTGRPLMR